MISWLGLLPLVSASTGPANLVPRPVVQVASGDDLTITAALATLPATGGCIELGPGVFAVAHPIVIDRDEVELRGAGLHTILRLVARANCPVLIIGSAATPPQRVVRQVVVANLVIDGNRLEQDFECYGGECNERGQAVIRNNGLTVRGAEDIHINQVVTRWARSGGVVLEKHCRQIRITNLESHDNEFDGLAAYETEASVFTGLDLHHNQYAGISLDWDFNGNRITDSDLHHNRSQGIFMRDSAENHFEKILIYANEAQGIFMAETPELADTAARNNRFSNLTITGNLAEGIRINDVSCTGNSLESSCVEANGQEDVSLAHPGLLAIRNHPTLCLAQRTLNLK